jgi:hypothetical protein
MSLVACHVQKFKASDVKGIQIHNQRESTNSKNVDINYSKTKLNYDLHNDSSVNYTQRVKDILAEEYTGTATIRKDAVVMNGIMVTAEADFFRNLSEQDTKDLFKEAYDYLKETYGEQNIVSAVVHMDETSPHLHLNLVPITQDGRLCGKEIFDRQGLIKLQDGVAERLKRFNLQRGVPSNKKHVDTQVYKRQQLKKVMEDNKTFEKYAPDFDKIEQAYNSASKNMMSSKYSIELDKLNYLRGSARRGLGSNFSTDQRDQTIKQLESSLKFYRTNYPAMEKRVQTIEKVLENNPALKEQFAKEVELQRQKQLQRNTKQPKKVRTR